MYKQNGKGWIKHFDFFLIDVVFLEKIRDEIKFKNTTELSAQIRQDKKIWKESDII